MRGQMGCVMFRTIALAFGIVAGAALPVMADEDQCQDLWFSKAAILSQGGYCLPSSLGEAVFGAADCSSETPELPDYLQDQISRIDALSSAASCTLDLTADTLKVWQMEARKTLVIQPVMSGRSDRCVMKAPTSLRVAPSAEADQLGWLERGDVVLIQHDPAGGADFAAKVRRGSVITEDIGWFSSSQCKPL